MLYLVRETHKLPMELQQVDTLRGQPSTALVYIRPNSFLRDLHRVEDTVFRRCEDRVRVRARGPVSALILLTRHTECWRYVAYKDNFRVAVMVGHIECREPALDMV